MFRETVKFKVPYKCPVCNGVGTVPVGFYLMQTVSSNAASQQCRSCSGSGIIYVQQESSHVE